MTENSTMWYGWSDDSDSELELPNQEAEAQRKRHRRGEFTPPRSRSWRRELDELEDERNRERELRDRVIPDSDDERDRPWVAVRRIRDYKPRPVSPSIPYYEREDLDYGDIDEERDAMERAKLFQATQKKSVRGRVSWDDPVQRPDFLFNGEEETLESTQEYREEEEEEDENY